MLQIQSIAISPDLPELARHRHGQKAGQLMLKRVE